MKLTRAEQKQVTRRTLIDAALRLSAQKGFSGLGLRELTREAGVAPPAFYRHFKDMDELGLTLVDEVGLGLRQMMRQARHRASKEQSVVRTSVAAFIDYVHANPNLFRLLLGERSGSSPAFRKALHGEIERFVGELTEDLERNARKPLREPGLAAEAIVAVVFTVGAETLDLPAHRRQALANRLVKSIRMILLGAQRAAR